jgi:WD40 repeat protein
MSHFRWAISGFALLASFVVAGESHYALAQERLVLKGLKLVSLAFAPDGKVLALGYHDGKVTLVDPSSGKELCRLSGHTETVKFLAFSPDGTTLATAGQDKTVRLWDMAERKVKAILKDHDGALMRVAFSPDGKVLASAGGPQRLQDRRKRRPTTLSAPHAA